MRVSLSVTNFSWRDERQGLATSLAGIAEAADRGGLYGLWVADHLLQADPYGAGPDETEMLEAYTTLGYLAARTSRIRLGTLVSAVTFRPPALLVKAVTTVDVLSGGRAMFGVGAGYQGEEAAAMGLPLPPVPERFDRPADVEWGRIGLPGSALHAGRAGGQPGAGLPPAPTDPHRRYRGEANTAAGRALCGRLQRVRHPR
jgi:alkanesulfonate monooxygenase SsuD/methylene tetrahydromethanopterin reductase-like flavin-dependent oxidoreductase (luciferase family)